MPDPFKPIGYVQVAREGPDSVGSLGGGTGGGGGGGFNWGGAISAVGGLVNAAGEIFGGQANSQALNEEAGGFDQEAAFYGKAADLEGENEVLAGSAGDIKIAQQERTNYGVLSSTESAQAGAGFAMSGSGLDIMRENAQQGHLATQMLGVQKGIDINTYAVQKEAYSASQEQAKAEAAKARSAASSASTGGLLGGIGSAVGSIASLAMMALPFM